MSETIVITRAGEPTGGYDEQGNPLLGASTDIPIAAIAVAPLQGDETAEQSGPLSINGYTLYLPFGKEILSTDFVSVRGVGGWQVQADASQADWASPFTDWTPGTVAVVRRAS